ncbi:MAG: hypothetical protein LLG16_03880 [Euryarchaeota archaeon]|nr:hypothetical protein [Euryarchaeota archaeon]
MFICHHCGAYIESGTKCPACGKLHPVLKFKDVQSKNEDPQLHWAKATLNSHKKRGCQIFITLAELVDMARETYQCPICGTELQWLYGIGSSKNSPTLDRAYNTNDISRETIWIICRRCNTMKQDNSFADLVKWAKRIVELEGRFR